MQFHPLAYMVKLNIEMSMADLIANVAKDSSCGIINAGTLANYEDGEENSQEMNSRFN